MSKRTPATKVLSMLLALIMVLSLFPIMGARAADKGTIKPDESITIAVGDTVTLDGTHNSMASSESWSSSNTSVATVAASGGSYDSDATVTGVGAGTATITHTISSYMGNSTETFTITVTGSGSGSGGGDTPTPSTGSYQVVVNKVWEGSDSHNDETVAFEIRSASGTALATGTIPAGSTQSAPVTVSEVPATVVETAVTNTSGASTLGNYTSAATLTSQESGTSSGGWVAQEYGAVESGNTYVYTYTSNGTTYALGRSGTSVIGSSSVLTNGTPNANISNDYKWTATKSGSSWYLKNNGNNYYFSLGNNSSTGYKEGAYLNSSQSSYYSALDIDDDDGSIWGTTYYNNYNVLASGSSIGASSSSYTVFTPWLYTEGGAVTTYTFTITNTPKSSGGGEEGGETGGGASVLDGMTVSKTSEQDGTTIGPDETVNLELEAYATGHEVTIPGTSEGGPYDIVLVLDTTFSMNSSIGNTTRLAALKSAVETMVNALPTDASAKAVVVNFEAYGTSYYSPSYNDAATSSVYNLSATGKTNLINYVKNLTPQGNSNQHYGFTYPDKGMTAAQNVINGWSDSNPKYVVFFTDGEPTDNATAVTTINTAKALKNAGVKIYSVGILADGYGGYVSSTGTAPSGTASISFNGATNTPGANNFLHAVSNNYPNASASGSTITFGSGSDQGYYMLGSDSTALTSAFSTIAGKITEETQVSTTSVTLDKNAVFKDVINTDYFDYSDATATVSIYDYDNGKWNELSGSKISTTKGNSDSKNTWTRKHTNDGTLTLNFANDGTITVTGFSYMDHFLPTTGTEADNVNAQKVVLKVTGLKLKDGVQGNVVQTVNTNTDVSGVYESSTATEAAALFPNPKVYIEALDASAASVTLRKTATPVNNSADEFNVKLEIDVTETQSIQTLVTSYIDDALANNKFWHVPSGYKDNQVATIVDSLPNSAKPLDKSDSGKTYTFRFKNLNGDTVATYVLRTSESNCGFALKIADNKFLVMNAGKINDGYDGDVQFKSQSVQDDFYSAITQSSSTSSTSTSSVKLNSVKDQMGEYFIYSDSAVADGGTFAPTTSATAAGTTITWTPAKGSACVASKPDTTTDGDVTTISITYTNYATLTYRVKADVNNSSFPFGTSIDTNNHATLSYSVDGKDKTKDFPVPQVKVFALKYDANGGTGAPAMQTKAETKDATSVNFTVSTTKPTRDGFTFMGWAYSADATTPDVGSSVTSTGVQTIYAVWEQNYNTPKTVLVDYSMKYQLATGVSSYQVGETTYTASNTDLGFTLSGGTLYYSPVYTNNTEAKSHDYTAFISASEVTVTLTDSSKTRITIIPASSVYYDDQLSASTDGAATTSDINGDGFVSSITGGSTTTNSTGAVRLDEKENGKHSVYTFTFTGTGIDLYATTDSHGNWAQAAIYTGTTTETMVVGTKTQTVKQYSETARYNVPTFSFTGLKYATYTVRLDALGNSYYRLDGVRVYGPVESSDTYANTNEQYAVYANLREALINNGTEVEITTEISDTTPEGGYVTSYSGPLYLDGTTGKSLVLTDKNGGPVKDKNGNLVYTSQFAAYKKDGPKNEIYLDGGTNPQSIAFKLNGVSGRLYIGLSAPETGSGSVILNNDSNKSIPVNSYVDMYYDITDLVKGSTTITITNSGSSRISVTNLKITGDAKLYNDVREAEAEAGTSSTITITGETTRARLFASARDIVREMAEPAVTITQQPQDYTGAVNSTARFTVQAKGDGLTYQWQYSDDGGATWLPSTLKKAVYSAKLTAEKNDRLVRCTVTDAYGNSVVSDPAAMKTTLTLTTQPQDYSGAVNSTAKFTVKAAGSGLTYQWEYSDDNGATWLPSTLKTAVYSAKLTAEKNNRLVRCTVTDANGNFVTTEAAAMKIALVITASPEDYTGPVNSTAKFTVKAVGSGLTYQWEYSDDNGATWLPSTLKTAVYSAKLTAVKDGRLVRCIVSDTFGNHEITASAAMRISE